jgi:tetratricopeptide (TPR) repeat protein
VNGKFFLRAALLLVLGATIWAGSARIGFFLHSHLGEEALAEARMNDALDHLSASLWWQPDNAPGYVLMARAVHLSLANGLPVNAWEQAGPEELLSAGTVLATRAISLSPADAWAWFGLAEVFRGYQLGESRRRRLMAGLRKDSEGADPPEETSGFAPGDRVIIAATLQAQTLEPTFYFYRDFLIQLNLRRGLPEPAAEEARESFRLMPLRSAHGILDDAHIRQLGDAVREGIDLSAGSPHVTAALLARSRAEFHEIVGRGDLAIGAWGDLRRLAGTKLAIECDYRIAMLHQDREEFAESVPLLAGIVAEGGGGSWRASTLRALARAHSHLEDHQVALEVLADFRDESPESFHPIMLMAREHALMGDNEEAGRLYRITTRRFPDEEGAWSNYVRFLWGEKRYQEALEQAREFARRMPDNPQAADYVRQLETEVAQLGS